MNAISRKQRDLVEKHKAGWVVTLVNSNQESAGCVRIRDTRSGIKEDTKLQTRDQKQYTTNKENIRKALGSQAL